MGSVTSRRKDPCFSCHCCLGGLWIRQLALELRQKWSETSSLGLLGKADKPCLEDEAHFTLCAETRCYFMRLKKKSHEVRGTSLVVQWLRGHGFDPSSGKIPRAAGQLSPRVTTTEAHAP